MEQPLQILYDRLESEYEIEGRPWTLFSELGDLSDESRRFVQYEHWAVCNFESDVFKDEAYAAKTQIVDYFSRRVHNTHNPHLLAKYHHFLLYVIRNNNYAPEAIKNYQKVLSYYLSIHNQGYHALHFSRILETVISLSLRYKLNENALRNQIDDYLKDASLSSKLKTFILEIVGRDEHELFKSTELSGYPQLYVDLASKEDDANLRERLLKIAVVLAQKTSDSKSGKIANEMLGDFEYSRIKPLDENNIAISHINENHYINIINYNKQAGQKEKTSKAIKEFEENKKHHRYLKFHSKIPMKNARQIRDIVNTQLEHLINDTPEMLVLRLCFDNGHLTFLPYKVAKKSTEEQIGRSIAGQLFTPKLKDLNNNTTTIPPEKLNEHQYYECFYQNHTLPFVYELLKRAIDKSRISYSQTKRTLLKTAFGINFEVSRGDSPMGYTWFSLVDIGIREFFRQFQRTVHEKPTDWRFTIDFLATKFEAILRDIVELSGDEITKVKQSGDSEVLTLEKMLDSSAVKNIFDEDDIFLFEHTFTKVGYNIRNEVAHGLLKPFDYTILKALLVFLCILRLNKVTAYIAKSKN